MTFLLTWSMSSWEDHEPSQRDREDWADCTLNLPTTIAQGRQETNSGNKQTGKEASRQLSPGGWDPRSSKEAA